MFTNLEPPLNGDRFGSEKMREEELTEEQKTELIEAKTKVKEIKERGSFKPAYKHIRKITAILNREGGQETVKRIALFELCLETANMLSLQSGKFLQAVDKPEPEVEQLQEKQKEKKSKKE